MKKLICEFLLNKKYDLNGPIVLRVANVQRILKQRSGKIMDIASKYRLFNLSISIDIVSDDRIKCSFYADDFNLRLKTEAEIDSIINLFISSFNDVFELEDDILIYFEYNEEISIDTKKKLCNKLINFYKNNEIDEYVKKIKKYIDEISI